MEETYEEFDELYESDEDIQYKNDVYSYNNKEVTDRNNGFF